MLWLWEKANIWILIIWNPRWRHDVVTISTLLALCSLKTQRTNHVKISCYFVVGLNKLLPTMLSCGRVNTLRPRWNEQHFADDIFKHIFVNENIWILIKKSLQFVPKGPNNNIRTLVQIMAWRHPGDKPLSEPMLVSLSTRICVPRPQWVNTPWRSYHVIVIHWCGPLREYLAFEKQTNKKQTKNRLNILASQLYKRRGQPISGFSSDLIEFRNKMSTKTTFLWNKNVQIITQYLWCNI